MKKKVGVYCRVSTLDQTKGIKSQEHALKEYCINNGLTGRRWYRDKVTGATTNRPAFNRLQKDIFAGEVGTVVVWKLDRLSRSLKDGINTLCDWLKKDVRIIAITQQLDFSGATGQLVASVLFAVAAMERENLRENIKRGLNAAKARNVKLGRPHSDLIEKIMPLLKEGMSVAEVANKLDKTRQGIYDCLKREGVDLNKVRKIH